MVDSRGGWGGGGFVRLLLWCELDSQNSGSRPNDSQTLTFENPCQHLCAFELQACHVGRACVSEAQSTAALPFAVVIPVNTWAV